MMTTHATEKVFQMNSWMSFFCDSVSNTLAKWVIFSEEVLDARKMYFLCVVKIVKMSSRAHLISYCAFILLLDCFHMHQCTTYFVTNPIINHSSFYYLHTYKCNDGKILDSKLYITIYLSYKYNKARIAMKIS